MDRLIIVFLCSALLAIGISFGIGRELDDRIVTRPWVVAAGVLLVVLCKEWGNWEVVSEWCMWFAVAGMPQAFRVAVIHIRSEKRGILLSMGIKKDDKKDARAA